MAGEQDQLNKVSFSQIVKAPITYMLMVALSLMWFFVYRFGLSSDQVNKNCEAEKMELRKELTLERADKAALINAILIKNGIIERQQQEKMMLDSNINNKLRPKAQEILNEK
jgi:hypothetical protein